MQQRVSQECSLEEEEKITLAETQFMMCWQCQQFPVRIKQSATGYLFASCEGYPRCKAAIYLPKLIRNIMVSEEQCPRCQ